ncbi:hypothetical protein Tco_0285628 [Tanacetum coccineum]
MAIGTGHRSNNYSESKRNDHLDNNRRQEQRNKGSNSQSVSINEKVFQSLIKTRYAKADPGQQSVDRSGKYDIGLILDDMLGRWVLVEFDSMDQVESVKTSKALKEIFLEFKDCEIRDDSGLYNDGCNKDCMEKNLDEMLGEILGVHSQGDCGNVYQLMIIMIRHLLAPRKRLPSLRLPSTPPVMI